jgi:hypothetical protein
MGDFTNPREWTAYRLANEADCPGPDSPESAGAKMLTSIRDAVVEAWEYQDEAPSEDCIEEIITEAADNGPDIYTHQMWSEFVDLAAYNEDPTELGADASDMDKCARVCLYLIAERCARSVISALKDEA